MFRSSVLLSDSALHLFLQTNLTTKEIDQRVSDEGLGGSFEVTPAKNPLTYKRPYLCRSVSITSSEGEGAMSSGRSCSGSDEEHEGRHSDHEDEEYCDISSSSDEFHLEIEAEN